MYEELVYQLRKWTENYARMCGAGATTQLVNQAANAIEESNKPRWIPVTEQLPYQDGKYICTVSSSIQYNNKQYRFVDILVFQDGCFFECGIKTERVTHWMPLPKPPKED